MRAPRTSTLATAVAVVAVTTTGLAGLAGCSDEGEPDSVPTTSFAPPSSTPPTTSDTPSPEPTSEPPTTPASPPATENAMPEVCSVVTAQQISDILFIPVELTTTDGGCRYAVPGDDTAPAVEYVQTPGFTDADVAEAKDTAVQRTDGRVQPVDAVGDDAFFAIGPGDTGQLVGAGGVLVGSTFVQVTVTQAQDLIEPEVGQYTIDAVGLAGDALGG